MAMVMKCNEADEVLDFLFIMRIDFVLADDVEISVLSLCGLLLFSGCPLSLRYSVRFDTAYFTEWACSARQS